MEITADTLVADIAARHPRSIEIFERHGIDFCCGGRRALGEACREHGAAVEDVAGEIAAAAAREMREDRVFTDAPLGALVDHIVSRYHTALREDLPRLGRMADKVAEVHGSRHPELRELADVYRELHDELTPHLATERGAGLPGRPSARGTRRGGGGRPGQRSTRSRRSTTGPARRSPACARSAAGSPSPRTAARPTGLSTRASRASSASCTSTSISRTTCSSRGS